MPKPTKFDDCDLPEKIVYTNKVFMYNNPTWDVLYPVVDIIRLLSKTTIISHCFGKGQNMIKMYGCQYNHLTIGVDLKNKKDYIDNILKGCIKFIYVFTDGPDPRSETLIKLAHDNKISCCCYSNIDKLYHFYDYSNVNECNIKKFKTAQETVDFMNLTNDAIKARNLQELFPEFEIVEAPVESKKSTLDECIEKMQTVALEEQAKIKKTEKISMKIPFSSAMDARKLKKMEYQKRQKEITYAPDPPFAEKPTEPVRKNILAKFLNM